MTLFIAILLLYYMEMSPAWYAAAVFLWLCHLYYHSTDENADWIDDL